MQKWDLGIRSRAVWCKARVHSQACHRVSRPTILSIWDVRFPKKGYRSTAEDIWFKCNLSLRFIPPINLWKICINLRPFSKKFHVPFFRKLRLLEIQNDENSKWKLVKPRWNPKSGLSDLENDLLTSTTSEGNFSKIIFLKLSVLEAAKEVAKSLKFYKFDKRAKL